MLLHTARQRRVRGAGSRAGFPEYLGYLGWPMLAVLAVLAVCCWRRLPVRAAAVAFAVLVRASRWAGPCWPAAGSTRASRCRGTGCRPSRSSAAVIPDRFSILADGAAAALLAFGLDAARAEPLRPRQAGAAWAVAPPLIAIAAARAAPAARRVASPRARRLDRGLHGAAAAGRRDVLVVPLPASTYTAPLRWQADTGVPSSMFGGYFMGPRRDGQAATDGAGLPVAGLYLNRLWESHGAVPPPRPPGPPPGGPDRRRRPHAAAAGAAHDVAPGRRRRGHHGKLRARPVPDQAARRSSGQCGRCSRLAPDAPSCLLSSWPSILARTEICLVPFTHLGPSPSESGNWPGYHETISMRLPPARG